MILINKKPKRFFFHYYKQKDKWSVHYNRKCHIVDNIICLEKIESKNNQRQPRKVIQGFTKKIEINNGQATIG